MAWSGCLLPFLLALVEVVAFSISALVDLSSSGWSWLSLSGLFRCLLFSLVMVTSGGDPDAGPAHPRRRRSRPSGPDDFRGPPRRFLQAGRMAGCRARPPT